MSAPFHHAFDLSPAAAIALQKALAERIERYDRLGDIHLLAGVDVGLEDAGQTTRAAVAVLDSATLTVVDQAVARRPTSFPYIPGLLSFREIPAVLEAFAALHRAPDLLLVDGQGIAHPRRIGIASHLGLLLDLPSIGVGKSRLVGKAEEPGRDKGCWTPLMDKGETIGAVLRSRTGIAPLYISIGHRVCLDTALAWTQRALTRYRLPETTRAAHRLASG